MWFHLQLFPNNVHGREFDLGSEQTLHPLTIDDRMSRMKNRPNETHIASHDVSNPLM